MKKNEVTKLQRQLNELNAEITEETLKYEQLKAGDKSLDDDIREKQRINASH